MLLLDVDMADQAESLRAGVEGVEEPELCVCLRRIRSQHFHNQDIGQSQETSLRSRKWPGRGNCSQNCKRL